MLGVPDIWYILRVLLDSDEYNKIIIHGFQLFQRSGARFDPNNEDDENRTMYDRLSELVERLCEKVHFLCFLLFCGM